MGSTLAQTHSRQFKTKDDHINYVAASLAAAHEAAATAYAHHKKTFPRAPDGITDVGCSGSALVYIKKPSFRLRECLKGLREARADDGIWVVSRFTKCADDQGVVGHEVACKAACQVLTERFPDEPRFQVRTWID